MSTEERDIAACFDFEGLFFQPGAGWKIRRPDLGKVGSRIPFERAYAEFLEIRRADPQAEVADYFALDEYELEQGAGGSADARRNLVPISRLLHYAHHHLFRRAELVVTAPPGFLGLIRDMTERAFASLDNFLMFENPFRRAVRRYPFEHGGDEPLPGSDERLAMQVAFYAAFLRFQDPTNETVARLRSQFGIVGRGYEKIYLYHTQDPLGTRLREFLNDNHEKLVGGRNAIVPMHIADVSAEAAGPGDRRGAARLPGDGGRPPADGGQLPGDGGAESGALPDEA